jgi:drug/metabolite transporter (DMT)-like permease
VALTLTLPITLAVLFGALLHAVWNAIVKRGGDPLVDMALLTLGASVLAAPLLWLAPAPAPASWPFLIASNLIHVGYYVTLVGTYRHVDLSVGYPLMRGSAPLLVTLAGVLLLGERPTPAMALGIVLICLGVASLALANGWHAMRGRALLWPFANAGLIAAYTLVDAAGARASGAAIGYVLWMFFLEGLPFALIVRWRRGPRFVDAALSRWRLGLAGGACSALSYGIAVWAMTRAPVGAVSALRETSVVFALAIGALVLKERPSRRALAGVAAVLAGAVALRA